MSAFTAKARVRFQDVDAAGIIFFARYFEYAHEAFDGFLGAIGFPLDEMLRTATFGMPLVHAEADFVAPSRYHDELILAVLPKAIGRTSLDVVARISCGSEPRARVVTRHVAVDRQTFRPTPWPNDLRRALEAKLDPNA